MGQVIVYQETGKPVSVVIPAAGYEPDYVGAKDVPAGQPFWIVDDSVIPQDRTFRDAWELDAEAMGEPSGIGGIYPPEKQEDSE